MLALNGCINEEIGEAIIAARFTLASTVFASATKGLEYLTDEAKGTEFSAGQAEIASGCR